MDALVFICMRGKRNSGEDFEVDIPSGVNVSILLLIVPCIKSKPC